MKPDISSDSSGLGNSNLSGSDLYRRARAYLQSEQVSGARMAMDEIQQLRQELEIYRVALKMQADELHANEERWRLAIEGAGDGIWDWDIRKNCIHLSAHWKQMHGYAETDVGDTFEDWTMRIHPDDKESAMALLEACLEGESESYTNEYRLIGKDGSYKWVLDRGMIVSRNDNKIPLRMIGTHSDITAHKKIEEDLRTSSRLLEASQAIAKVGTVEMDFATKTIYWSAETYRIHETSPEEFTPKIGSGLEYYAPGSREIISAALKAALEHGEVFDLEVQKYTMKGRKIDLRTTCRAVYEDGKLARLTGIFQDITERKQAERRQQHQNRVFEMLTEKTPLAIVLDTIARDVERINPTVLCTILLLDDDGKCLRHGAAPSLPDFYVKTIDGSAIGPSAGSCGTAAFTRQRVIVEDIETHPWWEDYRDIARKAELGSCWSQPIFSSNGRVLGTFAIYHRDISVPQASDLELIESEARLTALAIEKTLAESRLELAASVFTHAREGILITDVHGKILDVNNTFTDITGFTREEALKQNPRLLKSGLHGAEFFSAMWRRLETDGFWSGEIWNKRKNGDVYAQMMTISAVRDDSGRIQNYVNLFTDITPLKETQRQLEYIAHYDALTSLPNRVLLADRLKQAISQSHRNNWSIAVLYIDLDGFKSVNDSYGHDVGDELLVVVARQLSTVLREGDTLARIGGDEFIAVLVDLENSQDYEFAIKRLLHSASEPVEVNEHVLRVSASIGVTVYPQDGADADQLMRHADQAMYLAKQAGKNCFHLFDVAKDVAVKTQRESLEHIRNALDRREFVLYYQPKVNMKTGAVIGVEALIRWQHPERGLLPPAVFLPIIENHPISIEVGEWVIETALIQINDWRHQGLDIPISVNVGSVQLQSNNFARRLSELLRAYPEVPPSHLELEILETSALEDVTEVAELMRTCRELGVHFAVDDFGTGYSSLTYLKRLPAELLKIDQSFVRDMLDDPDDLAIVKGVIGLAAAFHRAVIAEGVETVAHGALLLPLGCELAQGYGIARPMPAAEIPKWVATWRPDPAWTVFNTSVNL